MRFAKNLVCVTLAVVGVACTKKAPDELPPSDASPARTDGATVLVTSSVNSQRAQQLATQYAQQRWPQYHPKAATALHMGSYWKVSIQFQEPVGGHVIIDTMTGAVLDAGTSNGEH